MTENIIKHREPSGDDFIKMDGVDLKATDKTVLDHVNLEVKKGELLAVIGTNGAGKSSILRCMAGMWSPSKGTITVDNLDRFDDDYEIRKFTAYLPSGPVLDNISIRENIHLFAEAYGIPEEIYRERMDSLLRMFDLKNQQDASVTGLSKGELKKTCLACILVSGAKLYILDEPFTGGIDPRGYNAFRNILDRLAANRDITVVFATQILELATSLADRLAIVNYGRVLCVGTIDELREAAKVGSKAPFDEVFTKLASKDSNVPVENFLESL